MSVRNSIVNDKSFDSADLYNKIQQWGASLVGFGDVNLGLVKEFRHMPGAIAIAVKHPPSEISILRKKGVVAYNNQFPDIDEILKQIEKRIVVYLRLLGWRALAIPPDSDQQDVTFISRLYPLFHHKTAATCSGLGWVGKNGLLINSSFGARLSWATVLTDAPLPVSDRPYMQGRCGTCTRCVDICPAGAISDSEWKRDINVRSKIDIVSCANQLKENNLILGRYICGLCIAVCPYGEKGTKLS